MKLNPENCIYTSQHLQQALKVNQNPSHFPARQTLSLSSMQKHLITRDSWWAFTTVASQRINYSFDYHTGKLNYLLQVDWMSRNIPSPHTTTTVATQVNSLVYHTTKSLGACLNPNFFQCLCMTKNSILHVLDTAFYPESKELNVLGGLYFTWRDKLLLSRAC